MRRRSITSLLFLLQPAARLAGRLRNGLSPWRRRLRPGATLPRPRTVEIWSERWREPQARVGQLEEALAARGGFVRSGGPFDRWDLDLRAGPLGGVKIRTAVEEHGSGGQLLRARIWPRASARGAIPAVTLALLVAFAWQRHEIGAGAGLVFGILVLLGFWLEGTGTATRLALEELGRSEEPVREAVPPYLFEAEDHPIEVDGVSAECLPTARETEWVRP